MFGRPLKTNNAISIGTRPSITRVLVELDVSKQYPYSVWLGFEKFDLIQQVEMEEFLSFCDRCESLGHMKTECIILNPHLLKDSQTITKVSPAVIATNIVGAKDNFISNNNIDSHGIVDMVPNPEWEPTANVNNIINTRGHVDGDGQENAENPVIMAAPSSTFVIPAVVSNFELNEGINNALVSTNLTISDAITSGVAAKLPTHVPLGSYLLVESDHTAGDNMVIVVAGGDVALSKQGSHIAPFVDATDGIDVTISVPLIVNSNVNPLDHSDWLIPYNPSVIRDFEEDNEDVSIGSKKDYDMNVVQVHNDDFAKVGKKNRVPSKFCC
ncbi:hypothetical protein M5K25_003235 [Dendrobium thyrsiflorum]|uniref:Uncharacterized protein n=1 Tax=Dendrobium thyrsiflorum TaxID=117978 RepID=A0ABD0VQC1_DENTH